MVLETDMKLCVTELDFFKKIFCCPKKWEKGPKIGFSEFIEKFGQFY